MSEILILIIFVVLVFFVMLLFLARSYKIPSEQNAIVVYGKIDPQDLEKFKIYDRGGVFVWPVIQNYYKLDLRTYTIKEEFEVQAQNEEELKILIKIEFSPNDLEKVTDAHFQKSKNQVEIDLLKAIEKEILSESKNYILKNLRNKEFNQRINKKVEAILENDGFRLDYFNLICQN